MSNGTEEAYVQFKRFGGLATEAPTSPLSSPSRDFTDAAKEILKVLLPALDEHDKLPSRQAAAIRPHRRSSFLLDPKMVGDLQRKGHSTGGE
ncbi:hypothetical protein OG439_31945 [Amycolatopsis sp. NBC_01307]|uniref:hypothetical protein n=1 Tax=Amycolatopsis sp. NBC_01307 TaxID=2903561 RepID=UPI002E13D363|nr:hypothetical protein OG439_31945 [Amycolatopsis sp. NBC_01307]